MDFLKRFASGLARRAHHQLGPPDASPGITITEIAVRPIPHLGIVGDQGRGQERHDRIGDDRGGSAGQVMTGALDKLKASIRQGPSQAAGGLEGNHGVLGVGEDQDRRLDRRDGALQLVELAQHGALLGQECAPEGVASVACMPPDLPVDVLVRPQRAAPPPGDPG